MRIGIARIAAETNTFSPVLTDMSTLLANNVRRGQDVLQDTSYASNIPGFLDVVSNETILGIISAHARPAGCLTAEALSTLLEWFSEDLKKVLPLDGLLLNLHGAFAGVSDPDVEGLFLQRVREIVGDEVVIGAALDLHANITMRKIANADIICGYHTHPHVDGRQTAQKVARILIDVLRGKTRPVMSAVKIPMITPAHTQITEKLPMKELMDAIRRQEEDERILSSSVFSVQPWLDIPEMGWCSVIVTDGDKELADRLARDLSEIAWNQKNEYLQPVPTYLEALDEAFSSDVRPVVISDFSDMMSGGGTGDSTWYLKAILSRKPQEPCYLTMVDPEAINEMRKAGEGASIILLIGGKQDKIYSSPVEVNGQVLRVLPPFPERKIPSSMGTIAVLRHENIYVVVSERLGLGADPIIYSAVGLNPEKAKILIAKSIVDFREGYKNVAKQFLLGEAPGVCSTNLRSLKWERVPRPIFPLDDPIIWNSSEALVYRSRSAY